MEVFSEFIIDHVESSVKTYPANLAIIDADYEDGKSISYQDMWERVCMLSKVIRHRLQSGIGEDLVTSTTPLVSIMMNRGIGSIVSILAVLKSGAAYVPVDPSFPADRQEYIFTHSQSQLLLVDETNFPAVQLMGPLPPVIIVDANTGYTSSNEMLIEEDGESISHRYRMKGELSPVYVLYTRFVNV